MVKEFTVLIPVVGFAEVQVEAENKDVAIEKAMEVVTLDDVVEWDAHRVVCEGNVYHGNCNEIDVIEE